MTPLDREPAEVERGGLTPGGHLDAEEIAAALDALDGAEHGAQAAVACELRAEGLTLRAIGDRFGVSTQTIMRWTDPAHAERQRVRGRARKESYRGRCLDCGAPTNGSNGPGKASKRCNPCAGAARRVWTLETVVAAIQRYAERYGRPPASPDFNPAFARARGGHWRAERFEADGDYPTANTVQRLFGSWSAGLRAAGFEPGRGGRPRVERERPR